MDISNSERNEVRYQHRGYAKYVEVVKLFGWPALQRFWGSYQADFAKGIGVKNANADPVDARILRLSKAAGVDVTPLVHFWGIQPERREALREAIAKAGLRPSAEIYDRLKRYESLIPMTNDDFRRHAQVIFPKGVHSGKNPNYGEGWYDVWIKRYDATHGEAAKTALSKIVTTYFPAGRPAG